jgi:hypothetical protein
MGDQHRLAQPAAIAAAARRTGIMNEQPPTEARRNLYNAAANTGKNWTPTARAVYNHNATTGKPLDIKISDRELPGMDREQARQLPMSHQLLLPMRPKWHGGETSSTAFITPNRKENQHVTSVSQQPEPRRLDRERNAQLHPRKSYNGRRHYLKPTELARTSAAVEQCGSGGNWQQCIYQNYTPGRNLPLEYRWRASQRRPWRNRARNSRSGSDQLTWPRSPSRGDGVTLNGEPAGTYGPYKAHGRPRATV